MQSLSFLEAHAHTLSFFRKSSIKKFLIKFRQSSLATLLKKKLWHRCASVNLAKFFKISILQNTYKWLGLDFAHFHKANSINHFIKRKVRKGIIIFWIYSTEFQHRRTIAKTNTFLQRNSTWNHPLGYGSRHEMNERMKIFNLFWIRYKIATIK